MVHIVPYGPTSGFPLNLPHEFHSWGILSTITIMQESQQNNILEIEYFFQEEMHSQILRGLNVWILL